MASRNRAFEIAVDEAGVPLGPARFQVEEPPAMFPLRVPADVWVHGTGDGARLEWVERWDFRNVSLVGLLWEFIRLRDASPDRILAFARRWGPLGICGHGRSAIHDDRCAPVRVSESEAPDGTRPVDASVPSTRFGSRNCYAEPIAAWHALAAELEAVLGIVMALRGGEPSSDQDWEVLGTPLARTAKGRFDVPLAPSLALRHLLRDPMARMSRTHHAVQRAQIARYLSALRKEARLEPTVEWPLDAEAPRTVWDVGLADPFDNNRADPNVPQLYSLLTKQLIAAVVSPFGALRCAVCGKLFGPEDRKCKPRDDVRHFCSDECRRTARMEQKSASARRQYAKRRAAAASATDGAGASTG